LLFISEIDDLHIKKNEAGNEKKINRFFTLNNLRKHPPYRELNRKKENDVL
jgi:hypothetical protein